MRTTLVLSCLSTLLLMALPAPALVETPAARDPAPPGPYAGPGPDAVPEGWRPWNDDVHKQCGEFALVFRNPDLREDSSGVIHAQGQFFIQFQVVGNNSEKVTKLSFSFGVTQDYLYDNPPINCNESIPDNPVGRGTGGVYLMYYRSDFDKSDGFFVPILTNNVPDGSYAAAVHAYDSTGNEVARAWAKALVDNCPGTGNERCGVDDEAAIKQDRTMPWPIVLPGDGVQTNAVDGLTIEFGEGLEEGSIEASLNGVTLALEEWTPPARDTDVVPNNDNQQCPADVAPICSRAVYGPGFKWLGPVNEGDVIRVSARDRNANFAEKIIHFGRDTSGGTVDIKTPEIQLTVLNGADVAIRPGDFHYFNVRLENVGNAEAHVSLGLNFTQGEGLDAYWEDEGGSRTNHIVVAQGQQAVARVHVLTDPGTPERTYSVEAAISYDKEGQAVQKTLDLSVKVDKAASGEHMGQHGNVNTTAGPTNATELASTSPGDEGGIPGPAFVGVTLGVAFASWVVSRRRRA